MRIRAIERWKTEQGSAIIEFSIIAFIFIITLLSVVEMARMVLVYTTLANAARVGARYAIVHGGDRTGTGADGPSGPGSTTQVESVVKDFASVGLLTVSSLTVTVSYPNGNNKAGSAVSVTVTYPYDPLLTYFNAILGDTLGSTSEGVIVF
jgi:Flp pilus assembly protein TadG